MNIKAQLHFYHSLLFFSLRSTAWHLDVTICPCIKGWFITSFPAHSWSYCLHFPLAAQAPNWWAPCRAPAQGAQQRWLLGMYRDAIGTAKAGVSTATGILQELWAKLHLHPTPPPCIWPHRFPSSRSPRALPGESSPSHTEVYETSVGFRAHIIFQTS